MATYVSSEAIYNYTSNEYISIARASSFDDERSSDYNMRYIIHFKV